MRKRKKRGNGGPYRGLMTPQQVADGMNVIARNARRLYEDAKIMLEAKRFPTACSLAILSIEESGKVSILLELACVTNRQQAADAWRAMGNHCEKNAHWLLSSSFYEKADSLAEFDKIHDRPSNHPQFLNIVKQLGFYVDYGRSEWWKPEDSFDEKMATRVVEISRQSLPKRETAVREVELWVKHIGQDWNNRQAVGKFYAYHKAMIEEGLSGHKLEDIERFLVIKAAA